MGNKQEVGITLIVLPVVIWIVIALANGLSFAQCWTGSCAADWFWGIIGIISIIIGLVLTVAGVAEEETTTETVD